jgi:hypothetical protein
MKEKKKKKKKQHSSLSRTEEKQTKVSTTINRMKKEKLATKKLHDYPKKKQTKKEVA